MVGLNGKVTNGAGHPAHKAGVNAEPYAPCVTRKMTEEERKFYGLDPAEPVKGVVVVMEKKRGKRIDPKKMASLIECGYTAAEIAEALETEEDVIWDRAKARGWVLKLRANEAPEPADEEEEEAKAADPEEEEEEEEEDEDDDEPEEDTEAMMMAYPQDRENNEYRFIDAEWLDKVAAGLTAGDVKHPGATWKKIPAKEHAARAIRHLNMFRKGDRSEDHLINASMRCMMASVLDAGKD